MGTLPNKGDIFLLVWLLSPRGDRTSNVITTADQVHTVVTSWGSVQALMQLIT